MVSKVTEVHSGIYEIFLPLPMRPTIINVYLIDCHGAWALIDTGMNSPESMQALQAAFSQVGVRLEDLNVLIGTHHHPDHFGASREIRRQSNAITYLHPLEAERANRMLFLGNTTPGESPEARTFFQSHGFPVDQYSSAGMRPVWLGTNLYSPVTEPDRKLSDREVIAIGERKFEVIWTPGHAPGHCVIYLRKEKVMIVGDHLLPKITPHVGIYPDTVGDPLGDFIDSQRKVQSFDVEQVLPAHGAIYPDLRARANELIEHHRSREEQMLDLTRSRAQTAFDVAQQIFGDEERPIFHVMAATFETLAHLEHAVVQRRAKKNQRGVQTVFQTV